MHHGPSFSGDQDSITPIDLSFGELFKLFNFDNEVKDPTGDVLHLPPGIFVRSISLESDLSPINALIKKQAVDMLSIKLEGIDEPLCVATRHIFINGDPSSLGDNVFAEDAEIIMGLHGPLKVESKTDFGSHDAYDISIPSPHLYVTPNGVVHHNSFIGLSLLKEAQRSGMDCFVIDSEKSFDFAWAEKVGIDTNPDKLPVIRTSQMLKIKLAISQIIEGKTLAERQNTFILFDSWGTLVSDVMLTKAANMSETRDMSLPFWKNELANLMKESDCTFFVVNHVIANTGGFGDPIGIPGGKRLYFNSDNVVLGQSMAKDKDSEGEISGAIISALAHKGRKSKAKSKLKYRINHDGGLDPFFGLLDDAVESGCVVKPTNGYYTRPGIEGDRKWREREIYCPEFWVPLFQKTNLEAFLDNKYTYSGTIDVGENSLLDLLKTDFKIERKGKASATAEEADPAETSAMDPDELNAMLEED